MKDPAFLFYPSDFLTGTSFFTDEQVGKYIRLLCHLHQHGHLPEKHVKMICGGHDEDIFAKLTQDGDGLYYQQRLQKEIDKRKAHSEKQKQNALMRWHKNGNAMAMPLINENENENINKDVSKDSNESISISIGEKNEKKIVQQPETWNGLKIGSKVTNRDHRIMAWDEYVKIQTSHNRRSCAPIDAPLVWLSSEEYSKLKAKYKSEDMVKAMILVMNNWKAKSKFAEQRNINDYLAIDDAWVAEKAVKELSIINGQTIDKLRKRDIMKEEFRKSSQTIFYTPIENGSEKTSE
jgi:hypothetical protein